MKHDEHFWWATLVRGFLALLVGSVVMIIPDMARTLLLLPVAIAISILALAAYWILDSVLVLLTSYMTDSSHAKIALRFQGITGIAVGVLLYRVFFLSIRLEWFLALIAVQALVTGASEFIAARHSRTHSLSRWNLAAAFVALAFSGAYGYLGVIARTQLEPQIVAWLVFAYLVAFGVAESLTAARMLYADRSVIFVKQ